MTKLATGVATAFVALVPALPAGAQAAAHTVTARATLSLPPVTGAGIQNLDFGSLSVGATADVPPGPAAGGVSSAGWRFTGVHKNRPVGLTFTLPADLFNGANALPVHWDNAGYGTVCVSGGGACLVSASFNPAADGGTYTLDIPNGIPGNNFDVTVYVGARTLVPSVPPGVYSAQVTLTMAYLF